MCARGDEIQSSIFLPAVLTASSSKGMISGTVYGNICYVNPTPLEHRDVMMMQR